MRIALCLALACASLSMFADKTYTIEVPNLVCAPAAVTDPFDGVKKTAYLPEVINLDAITVKKVLDINGVTGNYKVQTVYASKETPYIKCYQFVYGFGAGLNTNFNTGSVAVSNSNLSESVLALAFKKPTNKPCLGDRCLLFSPPRTTYTLAVQYVPIDANGKPGAPQYARYVVRVKKPTRDDIRCNIAYFRRIAAGVTQKCKITADIADALLKALAVSDGLSALIQFETVIGTYTADFYGLAGLTNAKGQYDARLFGSYVLNSDEEPVACLLVEMANSCLFGP